MKLLDARNLGPQPPKMTSSGDPPGGGTARGAKLHRSGPFLVVYGSGPRAEDVALEAARQCAARGVHAEMRPIDEIRQVRLVFYLALIVVLPSVLMTDPAVVAVVLPPFKRLILDYRARRPEGLRSLQDGNCEWFAVGVLQVCGLRAIMQHPQTKDLLEGARVCAKHYIDDFEPTVDVFRPYDSEFSILPDPDPGPDGDVVGRSIEDARQTIREWGVVDMHKVPRLRQRIDECRDHFETNRFSALYRPNPSAPNSNMLDLILDGPHGVIGDQKAWLENAARVCRYVREQLKKEVPGCEQPSTRRVQQQLRKLYQILRIVEQAIGDPGGPGLPG
jgi:hypothetical protein